MDKPHYLIRWFEFAHLPQHLQAVSKPIARLATQADDDLPDGAEKTAGLRKLLEAKDCFVRSAVEKRAAELKLDPDAQVVE